MLAFVIAMGAALAFQTVGGISPASAAAGLTFDPTHGVPGDSFTITAVWSDATRTGVDSGCQQPDPTGSLPPQDGTVTETFDGVSENWFVQNSAGSTTIFATVPLDAVPNPSVTVTVSCSLFPDTLTGTFTVDANDAGASLVLKPSSGPNPTTFSGTFSFTNKTGTWGCQIPPSDGPDLDVRYNGVSIPYTVTNNQPDRTVFQATTPAGATGTQTVSAYCQMSEPSTFQYVYASAPFTIAPRRATTSTTTTTTTTTATTATTAPTTVTTVPTTVTTAPTTVTTAPTTVTTAAASPTTATRVLSFQASTTTTTSTTTSTVPPSTTTTTVARGVAAAPPPPTTTPPAQVLGESTSRSAMVRSVRPIDGLSLDFETIGEDALLTALLILLIAFPADVFNSTLLGNYDEVRGWFRLNRLDGFAHRFEWIPRPLALFGFAGIGALLSSQMSSDFGFNRQSLALVLGLFCAIVAASLIYDVARGWYMNRRFREPNGLVVHPIGIVVGGLLVLLSRLAHFEPGYLYGLFTALRFQQPPNPNAEGRGLAYASVGLGAMGFLAWLAWSPVQDAAAKANPSFVVLVADAALSCLWVVALGAIVFGLIPLRFLYGESIKTWNTNVWRLIWGAGMFCFVVTVLHPENGFYGGSDHATLASVLIPFVGFAVFSFTFWGYFRYRYLWRGQPPEPEGAIEREVI